VLAVTVVTVSAALRIGIKHLEQMKE